MPFSGIQGIGKNFNGIQGIDSKKNLRSLSKKEKKQFQVIHVGFNRREEKTTVQSTADMEIMPHDLSR